MKREHQINFWYAVLAILAALAIRGVLTSSDHVRTIPYSEFRTLAADDRVTDLVIARSRITGSFRDVPDGQPQYFTTVRVEPDLAASLGGTGMTFTGGAGAPLPARPG